MIERSIRYGFLAFATALLMSCGGSTGDSEDDNGDGSNGDGSTTPDPTTPTGPQLGIFSAGGDFQAGIIGADPDDLDAGESSTLTVLIVDENENPVTDAVDVTFSSPCVGQTRSEFDQSVVTNTSGTIEVTYTAKGCDGEDKVTATANVDGTALSAATTLTTHQAPPGSIRFETADPQLIGIAGSGSLPESSIVTFKVTNDQGGPVSGQPVDFELTNNAGGVTLSGNNPGTTDTNGLVSITVNSGTVATTLRVEASTDTGSGTITTQSSRLSITTGVPDQDSFSLGLECMNIEGHEQDGVTTTATVLLADRFNNPAPDGTAVNFTTEGGSIGGACQTSDGGCTVTFTSQNPRNPDRRYSILAHATGEESFTDSNGSGRFDDGETFDDLPEAFRDDNENTVWDDAVFIDTNGNAIYDGPSGDFDGVLCDGPTECGNSSVTIRQSHVIVMSGSTAVIGIDPASIDLSGGAVTVEVSVEDTAGQQMAGGTTIEASTTHGSIVGESSVVQPCSNAPGPAVYEFIVEPEDNAGTGTFRVVVTSPERNIQSTASASVSE